MIYTDVIKYLLEPRHYYKTLIDRKENVFYAQGSLWSIKETPTSDGGVYFELFKNSALVLSLGFNEVVDILFIQENQEINIFLALLKNTSLYVS